MDALSFVIFPKNYKKTTMGHTKLLRQQAGHFHIYSELGYETCMIDLIPIPHQGLSPGQI